MDPLGVLIGPVEYSMVRKVFKTCQVTLNLHFDKKIIVIRCVVLKISYIEKCLDIQVITTFTAVHFNMFSNQIFDIFQNWVIITLFSSQILNIFQNLSSLPYFSRQIFDIGGYFEGPIKSAQGKNFQIFFLGIFQKICKVSKNIFWASYDHVVAQKSIFGQKSRKK